MLEIVYYELDEVGTDIWHLDVFPHWYYLKIKDDGGATHKFDLTKMFGRGNEPRTLEKFKQIFPMNAYIPYEDYIDKEES